MLTDKNCRILIQGITGKQGTVICRDMLDYGTNVVAGVTPGKGGTRIYNVPVYNTVDEALRDHPDIGAALITVPPQAMRDAALDVLGKGRIRLVNILTEGVPVRDAAEIVRVARKRGVHLVGPSSVGIICPADRVKIGAIGGNDPGVFYPGEIAIFSKSGGMCLSLATQIFNRHGFGTSTVVGMGGDRIAGSNFVDLLELAREDPDTELVILNGEVGGSYEEDAAEYIHRTDYPKPVIGLVSGVGAEHFFPRGSRMGHAGAVVGENEMGTYEHKVAAFEAAGIPAARSSDELVELVGQALRKTREDHLEEKDLRRPELVSIAKPKLESMKSQLRAVTVKTGITQLLDGQPYLLGYSLSDLIRHAPMEDILSMVLRRREPKPKERSLLRRLFVYHLKNLPLSRPAIETAVQSFHRGNPLNAAVSAGLLAQEAVAVENLHEELKESFSPQEAEALVLAGWVVMLVGHILGGDLRLEGNGHLENIFFRAVTGRAPHPGEADVFRGIFVACAEHTPAVPSSLAAIAAYSGGVSLKTALAAGITAMGDTHAGAGEGAAVAFRVEAAQAPSGLSAAERAQWLVDRYSGKSGGEKKKIPGYGHRYYGLYGRDPRAEALLELVENSGGDCVLLARAVEHVLQEQKANGLCLNVDGAIGAVIADLGIPPAAGKALFIIPRSAGILGQLLEQKEGSFFRLSNDSVSYTGPAPRPYREAKRGRSEAAR
jgi:succinyl-CoA synthetase alpha subunit